MAVMIQHADLSKSQLTFVLPWINSSQKSASIKFAEEIMKKKDYLKTPIEHIDIKTFDATDIINAMRGMSFSARDLAMAADIYDTMLRDKDCSIILTIAGSTSAAIKAMTVRTDNNGCICFIGVSLWYECRPGSTQVSPKVRQPAQRVMLFV